MAPRLTSFTTFERLSSRHRITGTLVAETGLRIGAGKSVGVEVSDQPVIRDALGQLFLPGSSLKGVLRSGLEAALRGLADDRLPACDLFVERCTKDIEPRLKSKQKVELGEILQTVCVPCGLFGSSYVAGRVFVADLPLAQGQPSRTEIRDGVGIDRDRRVARSKIKYDHEVVPPGTKFSLEIVLENLSDELQLGLVLRTLSLLHEGELRIGGQTSRGLGRVSLEGMRLERTDAKRLLARHGYELLDYESAQAKSEEAILTALNHAEEG